MNRIKLICAGSLKFRELQGLQQRYLQMINNYVEFSIHEIRDAPGNSEKEGKAMLHILKERDFVIALDRLGRIYDSPGLAGLLAEKMAHLPGRLVFLIGGADGLSQKMEPRFNLKLSFSALTMAHDLFRLVFLEQLYRSLTIIQGSPYHR